MRWYYTPTLGADLSQGFESFVKHDDSVDEHLDSLLKTIMAHEKKTGQKIDADLVTWRGCMTKVSDGSSSPARCQGRWLTDCRFWPVLSKSQTGMCAPATTKVERAAG